MSYTSSARRAAVCMLGLCLLAFVPMRAHAQLDKVDQKCRDTIAKGLAKATNSADKVITGCHKGRDSTKIQDTVDCNDLAQADTKDKFQKAKDKLEGSIAKSCTDAGASAALLERFVSCPEPCGTDLALSNPLASYADLGKCLGCLAGDIAERRETVMLGMPTEPVSDAEAKCRGAISKGYGKHLKTLLKERQKCQKEEDSTGNNELQPCDLYGDNSGKIQDALDAAEVGLDEAGCGSVNLSNIDSCDTTLAGLKTCLGAESKARGAEAFAGGYELEATICPSALTVKTHAGTGIGGATSVTRLEAGWNGVGHNQDLVDLYQYGVGLNCPNSGPPCGTCTITGVTDTGVQSGAFTRCRQDTTTECSNIFGIDGVCPGLQECSFFLGPPLPLSASSTPVCVVVRAQADIGGTAILETGEAPQLDLALRAVVHTGISVTQPCPVCVGDLTPQDGQPDGQCQGGANDTGACDVQGFDATFGTTSLDCPPVLGTNISGQGLEIVASFGTGMSSMPFGTKCDFPLNAMDCACAVCSGDTSVPCNSNTDCSDLGAGTCTSSGGGASRKPNDCSDLTCTETPPASERGECQNGPDVMYCDNQLRANGTGYISCDTNADCDALDPACDGNDCGECTLTEPRSCFLNPIVADGSPDTELPIVAGAFCTPPTTSTGVNSATGIPGPSRAIVQLEVKREY